MDTADTLSPDNVSLDDFGLFDPAVQQCPHAYYAKMRTDQPVFVTDAGGSDLYLITRYDHIAEVVKDTATFSSKFSGKGIPSGGELETRLAELHQELNGYERVGTMLTVDPPEQTRYRKLVSKAFTPRAIASLEPLIRELAHRLVDGFIEQGSIEFVESFAVPLPVTVIAKTLNVPDDRLADFKRWSDNSVAGIGTNISIDERIEAERGIIEFQHYFAEQLEQRRSSPQDDILTNLLEARIDKLEHPDLPDEPLTTAEILSILQQLLVAGNETTTKMLAEMMRLLGENPDEWAKLKADPARSKVVIEETLRMSTPTQGMWRVVTTDTRVGSVDIPAGSRVVAMYASANRDAEHFTAPDTFDPDRDGLANHLAFGKGIHFCVGANLSRLEGRVAAEVLAERLDSFSLSASNDFAYLPSFMLRGLIKLDIDLEPSTQTDRGNS